MLNSFHQKARRQSILSCRSICYAIVGGVVLFLSTASVWAGTPLIRTNPESFDFGYLPENAMAYKTFWLSNAGDDTLRISLVKPSCGCTTAPLDQKVIAPGDSVPLQVGFNSRHFNGVVNKVVHIHSNDASNTPADIFFTARVNQSDPTITVEPVRVSLEEIGKTKADVILENKSDAGYRPSFSEPPPPFLTCTFEPEVIPAGGKGELKVVVNDDVPVGPYQTSVTIWVEGAVPHPFTIPIKGVGYEE